MALTPGTKLGQYEITGILGVGGMGEVYRARDTKLGRGVAIKVLPDDLSKDRERRERFAREAKLLASLNHPAVATLYGFEDGFLVMELVEGETLAERISRGPISFDEAREFFIQIAEGVESAHEKGIVHRDLKPANVKVTPEGQMKILDFGLAKAMASEQDASAETSQSPTLTKGTALGAIMGTASYMSPEQARGKPIDKRTDIWAFGCCLYEALTGERAFSGETVTDILAGVVQREPNWSRLPAGLPATLDGLLRRCLEKNVRDRLRDIGEARIRLHEVSREPSSIRSTPASAKLRYGVPIAAAMAAALVTTIVVWRLAVPGRTSVQPIVRMTVGTAEGEQIAIEGGAFSYPALAISRDGRKIAFLAGEEGESRIYLRELGSIEARALAGTEDAELVFFSYDGASLGFLVRDVVWRVSAEGGVPLTLGKVHGSARGASWLPNGSIVIGGANRGLILLDPANGALEPLTYPDSARGEQYHAWPHVMRGGAHVLFTVVTGLGSDLGILSLESKEWRILEQTSGAAQPHYVESGHLVFFRPGGLFAAPFSAPRMTLEGGADQVAEGVVGIFNAGLDLGLFAVSETGNLAFVPGDTDTEQGYVVRVDRSGRAETLSEPGRYGFGLSVSPDGRRFVVSARVRSSSDLWVVDLERSSRSRSTSDNANIWPIWTADGRVLFSRFGTGSFDLYTIPPAGGTLDIILSRENDQFPRSASRDGQLLAFTELHPESRGDIHVLTLDGNTDRAPYPSIATPAYENNASFSPDGRFLAYDSNETGQFEVYAQPLSGEGGKVLVSTGGGESPRWSPQGDEIFYRRDRSMMAAPIQIEPTLRAGAPALLFDGPYAEESFDVFPDGEHFAMVTEPQVDLRVITVVVNWTSELKQAVTASSRR